MLTCVSVLWKHSHSYKQSKEVSRKLALSLGLKQNLSVSGFPFITKIAVVSEMLVFGKFPQIT